MLISLIVQSYERPDKLKGCLEYLKKNLLDGLRTVDYELTVADDGSVNPAVKDILGSQLCTDICHRVLITDDRSRGPGYLLNKACENLRGDFTIHIEDDFWLLNPMHEDDLFACFEAFSKIKTLELIRLRRIIGDASEKYRLNEYETGSEPGMYAFGGKEFRMFKLYKAGGPSYQYTGNAHVRRGDTWLRLGPYPEGVDIWGLENRYAARFRHKGFRTGRFKDGWFSHTATELSSTKYLKREE